MVKAIDVQAEAAKLPVLDGRTPETPTEAFAESFATLSPYRDGGIFVGSFVGDSAWERHCNGDEIVQIVAGSAIVTVIAEDEEHKLDMQAGMITVVPQGCWHRFHAPDGVTVMTATPQPTEHSTAADPRQ